MINPSFKELSEVSPSRYEICVLVMKRARRIIEGSKPLVESEAAKPVTLALDEIMAKKVHEVPTEE
uniref:DNA-directed RNA polymerase subunit omega n=1 Tax=Ndongobacter massiliensis TaxID=1871025 RepID=UPI000931106A|nr:DNA-directed RNA polymerase subunit omega [Ndongobacter massiliensis]